MSVKQASAPVPFDTTRRMDNASILSSGRAGVVQPVSFSNLHRGDSASGRVTLQVDLAEMPKPLENAVIARVQAWCIPRPALPQFAGIDEYTHAYHGKAQTVLNGATRDPAPVFDVIDVPLDLTNLQTSDFFRALGLSLQPGVPINSDYIDSYNLVQNFRLNAFTTKNTALPLRQGRSWPCCNA